MLIAGFADYLSTTAATSVACLIERWEAQPLAELDSETFSDFATRRPVVRVVDGERAVEWPSIESPRV